MQAQNKGYDLTATLNDQVVSYDDLGEGNVPIVFIHGFPFDKTMWRKQLDDLKSTHRVIAYDLHGFGKSTDEDTALSMDLFGDDLINFLDHLYIEKAIICGLSMGGYIALNVMQRFPERFEALVLCDTQCIADSDEARGKRMAAIEDINANGTKEFVENFLKGAFYEGSFTSKKEVVEELKNVVSSNSPEVLTRGLKALANRSETCSTLKKISVPTLIICGKEDGLTPPVRSQEMHEKIKDSTLRIIENAGHVSNLEQPEAFNKHLREFLNG